LVAVKSDSKIDRAVTHDLGWGTLQDDAGLFLL
jgi:hypothetical protein